MIVRHSTNADTIAPTNSPHPTVNSQTTLKTVSIRACPDALVTVVRPNGHIT